MLALYHWFYFSIILCQGGYGLDVDHQKAGDHYQQAGDSAMEAMKGKLASKYYMAAEESWALVEWTGNIIWYTLKDLPFSILYSNNMSVLSVVHVIIYS